MSSVKQLFSQSVIYGLSTVVPKLLNFLLVFVHTYFFVDASHYGVVNELYAYLTVLLIILTFGLETGFFRFVSKGYDRELVYSTLFHFLLITSTLASAFFFAFANPIARSLGTVYDASYVYTLGLIISLDAFMAIPFAKLRSENRPMVFSAIKIFGVVVNILLNVFFYVILTPGDHQGLFPNVNPVYFIFFSNLVQNIVTVLVLLFYTGVPRFRVDFSLLKSVLRYSFPLLIAGLAGTANESFDRIFLKYMLPDESNALYQIGIYSANFKLAVLLVLFTQMYRFAAEPFFFNNQGKPDSVQVFGKAMKYFLVFCLMIFLFVTFNLPIFKYYIGPDYRSGLYVVPILLIANILNGTFFNLSFWYKLTGETIYGVKYAAIGASITIVSNIILIPLLGFYGAALSRVITYSFMNFLSYRDGKKSGFIWFDTTHFKKYTLLFTAILAISTVLFFAKPIFSVIFINIALLFFAYYFLKTEQVNVPILDRLNFWHDKSKN